MADVLEKGDLYFFFRPKVDADNPQGLDDVQRFYLVMVPDDYAKGRLLIVGKKLMPEIEPGKSKQSERQWLMTSLIDKPETIGKELGPITYHTKTRGERTQAEAIPVAEARYVLFDYEDTSRLAYKLATPKSPGKVQKAFRIESEASYVVSIRNPALDVPGFPDEKPDYPKKLEKLFADERWLSVTKPELLNYANVQLVFIGARENLANVKVKVTGKPNLFKKLGLDKSKWPTAALEKGEFPAPQYQAETHPPAGDRSKGGERGGRKATRRPSAAGVAKALKGVDFPNNQADLVDYAADHDANEAIVDTLKQLPHRKFNTMADVEKALAEVR